MNVFQYGWKNYLNFWTKTGYSDFKGRASRKEYWSTFLIYTLLTLPVSLFSKLSGVDLTFLWAGIHLIPWNCLVVRRLHDTNRSGILVVVYNVLSYFGMFTLFSNFANIFTNLVIKLWPWLEPYISYGEITNDAISQANFYAMKALDNFKILGIFAIIWLLSVFVISVIIFVLCLIKGDKGKNNYGNDPQSDDCFDELNDGAVAKSEFDSAEQIVKSIMIAEGYDKKSSGERKMKILRCAKCGKVVCVFTDSANPDIYCCGVVMNELVANTTDAAVEKHVPVVEKNGSSAYVKVGSAAHPMTAEHHIDWIMLVGTKNVQLANVKDQEAAVASFALSEGEDVANVYAYCNLHGLWAVK